LLRLGEFVSDSELIPESDTLPFTLTDWLAEPLPEILGESDTDPETDAEGETVAADKEGCAD
jgi:hypothetical protein